ncbi:hypothetical protein K435DRAFT_778699 [Dendrothele bispora CBS 962.96]|uniref:Uncharacterized protein n=1 Tax=Dendrothele bispora (strain CBS 962.96) TaxID=1314807 RepID=A0A4V6T5F2_DENBC|nr:hypothetical protein K435DRAFT_778699 [Dendrothele bispora CBS 962.96]
MIYDKSQPEIPQDAPPSYETLTNTLSASSSTTQQSFQQSGFQPDVKRPLDAQSSSSSSHAPTTPTSPPLSAGSYKGKGKAPASSSSSNSWWNGFGYLSMSQNARQVRTTVLSIIKDLVRGSETTGGGGGGGHDYAAARSILESCSEACAGYSLSLAELLQEKSIEEHTPLYWAIVNRPPEDHRRRRQRDGRGQGEQQGQDEEAGSPDLLTCLLSFTAPLQPSTVSEVRLACLLTSDQELFKRLRMSPDFAPLSGTDQMLLGVTMIPDDVVVENLDGDDGAFAADLRITQFQKRMRISKEIGVEFIARGRMWRLAFKISQNNRRHSKARPGAWCISLSLMENSPPTVLDSRLIIPHAQVSSDAPASPSPSGSKKSPIHIRMQTSDELVPPEMFKHAHQVREILVPLSADGVVGTLEHAGSSYIGPDDSLKARLEAKLAKPGQDCIIC